MYRLISRIIILRTPSSIESISEIPLKSLRFLSNSSEIVSSPESVHSENNEKPVILFFENHGFSKSQISNLVKKCPRVLSSNPEKTLLPKLLFFQSKGVSSPVIADLVSRFPTILSRSLNKQIIPSFDYVQEILHTVDRTVAAIKRNVGLITWDLQVYVCPNIEILRKNGVPDSQIGTILQYQPRVFFINSAGFEEIVKKVSEMGFNPKRFMFVLAVFAMRAMNKSTWKKKVEVYRKWGWSDEQILVAFGKNPWCMMTSEDKINSAMDFFVNKMGCESSRIARRPSLLCLSLKKRIYPRGFVYQDLLSKDLIKKDANIRLLFEYTEKQFLVKFIKPHEKSNPGLLKLYTEKLEASKRLEV